MSRKRTRRFSKRHITYPLVDALVNLRLKLGWSQRDLADEFGRSQSAVTEMEVGMHEPKISTLVRYAEVMGHHIEIRIVGPDKKPVFGLVLIPHVLVDSEGDEDL